MYASLRGRTVIDLAVGEARPGVPMATDTIVEWASHSRPCTWHKRAEEILDRLAGLPATATPSTNRGRSNVTGRLVDQRRTRKWRWVTPSASISPIRSSATPAGSSP